MARPAVQEAECRRIMALPKSVREDVVWSRKPNEAWLEARVRVRGGFRGSLELVGTVNTERPSRYSFALLMNKKRINGLDVNGSHRNT